MIGVFAPQSSRYAAELVRYGLMRSYSRAQVGSVNQQYDERCPDICVFIEPGSAQEIQLRDAISRVAKIIVLGTVSSAIGELLGIDVSDLPDDCDRWDYCEPAVSHSWSESEGRISYASLPHDLITPVSDRALLRYDFTNEWNNLGYGHVRTDGSIWSISLVAKPVAQNVKELAGVCLGEEVVSSYITLTQLGHAEILWVNRPVGLIDSQEFRLLETFLSNHAAERLPCLPMLRETPYGFDGSCTMRLDCDESIVSARTLFSLYERRGIPFSLAVKTGQDISRQDIELLDDVISTGGALLSHSVNHKPNWGDDESDVSAEAVVAQQWMLGNIPGLTKVDFAVSPFHQNPDYAVAGIAPHYAGFIGGIICNDPQYLLARGGALYGVDGLVSHSQQCMLHGDCVLQPMARQMDVYRQAATACFQSGAMLGYLDHPFSDYQYGWQTEEQRLQFHSEWLDLLQAQGNILFLNENDAMSYIVQKSSATISLRDDLVSIESANQMADLRMAYEYKGDVCASMN